MAEIKKPDKKQEKSEKSKLVIEKKEYVSLIRIMQTDIPGNKRLLTGLTYIKGVSWAISNAMCKILKMNPDKKISELDKNEIDKIIEFLKNPTHLPDFLLNRRKDFETGKSSHLIGTELDMKKEFDIRRLKKIRSYRGLRHATGQPTRGQRTKSHFRSHGKKKAVGVQKKKEAPAKAGGK
ncbi:MAG TPA: 30S ribosomal protein S13 [Candidatus Nanoarchaeia archaeon]|nr:30S ribosomal protein S13 [Candidatus Pacearchaeota archaeon]HLC87318.1 30S ribosomal protein S13 [Candidatus Nanoarchaeia archaeon]